MATFKEFYGRQFDHDTSLTEFINPLHVYDGVSVNKAVRLVN